MTHFVGNLHTFKLSQHKPNDKTKNRLKSARNTDKVR